MTNAETPAVTAWDCADNYKLRGAEPKQQPMRHALGFPSFPTYSSRTTLLQDAKLRLFITPKRYPSACKTPLFPPRVSMPTTIISETSRALPTVLYSLTLLSSITHPLSRLSRLYDLLPTLSD
jgi:hypothetical protein